MSYQSSRSNVSKESMKSILDQLLSSFDDGRPNIDYRKSKAIHELQKKIDDDTTAMSDNSLELLERMYDFIHEGIVDEETTVTSVSDADTVEHLLDRIYDILGPREQKSQSLSHKRQLSMDESTLSSSSHQYRTQTKSKRRTDGSMDDRTNSTFSSYTTNQSDSTRLKSNCNERLRSYSSPERRSPRKPKHSKRSSSFDPVGRSHFDGSIKSKGSLETAVKKLIKKKLLNTHQNDEPKNSNLLELERKVDELSKLLDEEMGIADKLDQVGKVLQTKQRENKSQTERNKLIKRVGELESLLTREKGNKERKLKELSALVAKAESEEDENDNLSYQSSMKSTIASNFGSSFVPNHQFEGISNFDEFSMPQSETDITITRGSANKSGFVSRPENSPGSFVSGNKPIRFQRRLQDYDAPFNGAGEQSWQGQKSQKSYYEPEQSSRRTLPQGVGDYASQNERSRQGPGQGPRQELPQGLGPQQQAQKMKNRPLMSTTDFGTFENSTQHTDNTTHSKSTVSINNSSRYTTDNDDVTCLYSAVTPVHDHRSLKPPQYMAPDPNIDEVGDFIDEERPRQEQVTFKSDSPYSRSSSKGSYFTRAGFNYTKRALSEDDSTVGTGTNTLRSALKNGSTWQRSSQQNHDFPPYSPMDSHAPVHFRVRSEQEDYSPLRACTPSEILSRNASFDTMHTKPLSDAIEQRIFDRVVNAILSQETKNKTPTNHVQVSQDRKKKIRDGSEIIALSAITSLKAGKTEEEVKDDIAKLLEAYVSRLNGDQDDISVMKENRNIQNIPGNSNMRGNSKDALSVKSMSSTASNRINLKWANMSVAAAATVLQTQGTESIAHAASSAVLQFYKKVDRKIDPNLAIGLAAAQASTAVLSAGGSRSTAAAVSIAVIKSASMRNSAKLLNKLALLDLINQDDYNKVYGHLQDEDVVDDESSEATRIARTSGQQQLYRDDGVAVSLSKYIDSRSNSLDQRHNLLVNPADDGSVEVSLAKIYLNEQALKDPRRIRGGSNLHGEQTTPGSLRTANRPGLPPRYPASNVDDNIDSNSLTSSPIKQFMPPKAVQSKRVTDFLEGSENEDKMNVTRRKNGVFGKMFKKFQKKRVVI